jgi:hypothetical protein
VPPWTATGFNDSIREEWWNKYKKHAGLGPYGLLLLRPPFGGPFHVTGRDLQRLLDACSVRGCRNGSLKQDWACLLHGQPGFYSPPSSLNAKGDGLSSVRDHWPWPLAIYNWPSRMVQEVERKLRGDSRSGNAVLYQLSITAPLASSSKPWFPWVDDRCFLVLPCSDQR